jgi:hypothetical protein
MDACQSWVGKFKKNSLQTTKEIFGIFYFENVYITIPINLK